MKFTLDQSVLFVGKKSLQDTAPAVHTVTVWDYSVRYNQYDIRFQDGTIVHGLHEHELYLPEQT